jgi:predicted RNA-binding protein with PUA domain
LRLFFPFRQNKSKKNAEIKKKCVNLYGDYGNVHRPPVLEAKNVLLKGASKNSKIKACDRDKSGVYISK